MKVASVTLVVQEDTMTQTGEIDQFSFFCIVKKKKKKNRFDNDMRTKCHAFIRF